MTHDDIKALSPGLELDTLVAEKVMGRECICEQMTCHMHTVTGCLTCRPVNRYCPIHAGDGLERFSSDPADAWALAQYLSDHNYHVSVQNCHYPEFHWCVFVSSNDESLGDTEPGEGMGDFPLAICHAALKVKLSEEQYHAQAVQE